MRIFIFAGHHGDYSSELAIALAKRTEVTLLLDDKQASDDCGERQLDTFARLGTLLIFSRRRFHLITLMKVAYVCIFKRPDLCVTHAHFDPVIFAAHRIIALFCPIYLVVHDPIPHTGRDAILSDKAKSIDKRGRALASVLLVHGAFCKTQLQSTGEVCGRPVLEIPHGPILRPPEVVEATDPPFALMFGRMEAYKGLDVLLAACQSLASQGRPVRCKLMGRGPELERLKQQFENVGAEVFCGFVAREDAILALQQSALVLAPYTEATQSGVVAAAFASGRPVLASAVGGLVDFIVHDYNGLLVPKADAAALAAALHLLLSNATERARLAHGAEQTAATSNSWQRYAEIIEDFAKFSVRLP